LFISQLPQWREEKSSDKEISRKQNQQNPANPRLHINKPFEVCLSPVLPQT